MPHTAPLTHSNLKETELVTVLRENSQRKHTASVLLPWKYAKPTSKNFFNIDYIFLAIPSNMYYAKKLTESILLGLSIKVYIKENETNLTIYQQTLNTTSWNFTFFLRKTKVVTSILSRYHKTLTNQRTIYRNKELPTKVTYFLEERRIYSEVLGHDIEAEEVAVDASPSHGKAIQVLMFGSCQPKQLQLIFTLTNKKKRLRKKLKLSELH